MIESDVRFSSMPSAALWQRYATDRSASARNRLVEQYVPLVKYVLRSSRIAPTTVIDYDDLVSEGVLGLVQSIERYDPTTGVKFQTYAIPRIRGAMLDALGKLDPVSRRMRRTRRAIAAARQQLESCLARTPTSDEIAVCAGLSLQQVREPLLATGGATISLDAARETDSGGVSVFEVAAAIPDVTEVLAHRQVIDQLSTAIRELPQRLQMVLALYYGDELNQREVASVMGCSESRVSQLLARARKRLRQGLQIQGVECAA